MLANSDIRSTAKTKGVRLWEIAEFLKVSGDRVKARSNGGEYSQLTRTVFKIKNAAQSAGTL